MQKEITALAPSTIKIKIIAPPERKYSVWIEYFTAYQGIEYCESSFSISDSVYGSTFFVATGFHGLHVIVGTIFLLVCLVRLLMGILSITHHLGLTAAIWYWHFVDVVWLFLFA